MMMRKEIGLCFFVICNVFLLDASVSGLSEKILSLPMPSTYWPNRCMTLKEALVTSEVNILSGYHISNEPRTVTIECGRYTGFVFIIENFLSGLKGDEITQQEKEKIKEIKRQFECAAQQWPKSQPEQGAFDYDCRRICGFRGLVLGELRKELIACPGMTQKHFDWIQNNKRDFAVVSAISEFIHTYYTTGGDSAVVEDFFAYLDGQLR